MHYAQPSYQLGHAGYVSPFTEFMDGFLEQHPEVQEQQRSGWYLFWDQHVDQDDLKRAGFDTVPLKGYDYFGSDTQQDAVEGRCYEDRYVFAINK